MRMIKKYLKKGYIPREKTRNYWWSEINNIIIEYQKTAEASGDLIGNEIANKIMKGSRSSPQNNSETITNGHDNGIPNQRYISPEGKQNYWWSDINSIIMGYQKIINLF